jgi:hypothetical protein
MDLMLSPIGTRLSAGTLMTTVSSLIASSGGLTAPVVEAGGPITPPVDPRLHQVV